MIDESMKNPKDETPFDKDFEDARNVLKKKEIQSYIKMIFWLGVSGFGLYKVLRGTKYLGYLEGYGHMTALLKEGLVESLEAFKEVK